MITRNNVPLLFPSIFAQRGHKLMPSNQIHQSPPQLPTRRRSSHRQFPKPIRTNPIHPQTPRTKPRQKPTGTRRDAASGFGAPVRYGTVGHAGGVSSGPRETVRTARRRSRIDRVASTARSGLRGTRPGRERRRDRGVRTDRMTVVQRAPPQGTHRSATKLARKMRMTALEVSIVRKKCFALKIWGI